MIEEANKLDIQEARRARTRAKEHAYLKWKCLTLKRNPLAFALRFAKYSLIKSRKEQVDQIEKLRIYKTDELSIEDNKSDKNVDESGTLKISEIFDYEILEDKNEFSDLLTFFFEKRALCQNSRQDNWAEFLEAKNQDILPHLETLDAMAREQCTKMISIRKSMKKLLNPDLFHLLATHTQRLRRKVYVTKWTGPSKILGDYIGDRMIGLTHIPPFNIYLNQKILKVKIPQRKRQEKGWLKVVDMLTDNLFETALSIHQLECLSESLNNRAALDRISNCLFFLLEIKCSDQLINTCICVAKGDFNIESTIELPDVMNHKAMMAYMKVLTTADLSRFTLFGRDLEVNVSIPKEKIKDFVLNLGKMNGKSSPRDSQAKKQEVKKREAKEARKNESVKGLEKIFQIQSKLSRYQFKSSKARAPTKKKSQEDEKAKPVVICLGNVQAPKQSSMQFLSFGEDQD